MMWELAYVLERDEVGILSANTSYTEYRILAQQTSPAAPLQ